MTGDKFQAIKNVDSTLHQFQQTGGDTEAGTAVFSRKLFLHRDWEEFNVPQAVVAADYTYNDHYVGQYETNIRRIWGT